jgi:hypothetical protein
LRRIAAGLRTLHQASPEIWATSGIQIRFCTFGQV